MPKIEIAIALLLLLPLIFAFKALVFPKYFQNGFIASAFCFVYFLICFGLNFEVNQSSYLIKINWLEWNAHKISFEIFLNSTQAIFLTLISFIALLVNVFSISYMHDEENTARYYGFLSLFIFSMFGFVMSDNLFFMFIFWELLGFSSFLLVGFWFKNIKAAKAAMKAFLVNRVADMGFIVAICICYSVWGTFSLQEIIELQQSGTITAPVLYAFLIGGGFLIASLGKSAQFPFQGWLPDAMQGPTPVSALMHAATMVAAGIFLLCKVFILLHPDILMFATCIGCITAFMGSYTAAGQYDLKKILAYSTISQLGFMMIALGVGHPELAFFHLITHAFFKSCLFLTAGSIIHAMESIKARLIKTEIKVNFDTQVIKMIGGLRKQMPFTFGIYLVATLGASGFPFTSGFLSKDEILSSTFIWANSQANSFYYFIPILALMSTFLTAFYMGRQFIMLFFGQNEFANQLKNHFNQSEEKDGNWESFKENYLSVKESGLFMLVPMALLGLFSAWIFFSWHPFSISYAWIFDFIHFEGITNRLTHGSSFVHISIILFSIFLVCLGLFSANMIYRKHPSSRFLMMQSIFSKSKLGLKLSINHFYLDYFYKIGIIYPTLSIAKFCVKIESKLNEMITLLTYIIVGLAHFTFWIDRVVIDGLLVKGLARCSVQISYTLKKSTNGNIGFYLYAFILAVFGIGVLYFLLK